MNCNRKITYLSNFAILFWILIILLDRLHIKDNLISRRLVRQKGSDKVSSKEKGILLIKRLNSNGLKMQPCRTPLVY